MYQPVPLNWMAGADASFSTGRAQVGQLSSGASENFRTSSNVPHFGHSYS